MSGMFLYTRSTRETQQDVNSPLMGSPVIAALIAHAAFWLLLPYGWLWQEVTGRGVGVFLALWLAGLYGLPYLSPHGAMLFSSYVAVLDIVLVFLIFKGDVRLT